MSRENDITAEEYLKLAFIIDSTIDSLFLLDTFLIFVFLLQLGSILNERKRK